MKLKLHKDYIEERDMGKAIVEGIEGHEGAVEVDANEGDTELDIYKKALSKINTRTVRNVRGYPPEREFVINVPANATAEDVGLAALEQTPRGFGAQLKAGVGEGVLATTGLLGEVGRGYQAKSPLFQRVYGKQLPATGVVNEWAKKATDVAAPETPAEEQIRTAARIATETAPWTLMGGPGASVLKQLPSVAGSALGGAYGEQIAGALPGGLSAKGGEIVGQLLGGFGPAGMLAAGKKGLSLATKGAREKLIGQPVREAAAAGELALGDVAVRPEVAQGIGIAQKMQLPTTLAEQTGIPELLAEQKRLLNVGTVPAPVEQARVNEVNRIIELFRREKAPQVASMQNINTVVDAATGKVTSRLGELARIEGETKEAIGALPTKEMAKAEAQAQVAPARAALTGEVGQIIAGMPEPFTAATGATLRGGIEEAERAARNQFSEQAENLGLSDVNLVVPFEKFSNAVKAIDWETKLGENIPGKILNVIEKMQESGDVTFKDLMILRSDIAGEIKNASSGATKNAKLGKNLRLVREVLDNELDSAGAQFGGLADKYSAYRQMYKNDVINKYEDALYKVTQLNGRGFYQTNAEDLAKMFLDGETEAAQLSAVIRDDPKMLKAAESAIFDDLRNKVVKDNEIDGGKLLNWVSKKSQILNQFPTIRDKVYNLQSRNEALQARAIELDRRASEIQDKILIDAAQKNATLKGTLSQLADERAALQNTPLGKQMEKLYGAGAYEASDVATAAVKNPKLMKDFLSKLDTDGVSSLRRHVWDSVADNPTNADRFIRDNREGLELLFEKEHLENITMLAEAMKQAGRIPFGGGLEQMRRASSPAMTRLAEQSGQTVKGAVSAALGVARGRSGKWQEFSGAFTKFADAAGGRKGNEIMREFLYNPDAATALANIASTSPQKQKAGLNWAKAWGMGLIIEHGLGPRKNESLVEG